MVRVLLLLLSCAAASASTFFSALAQRIVPRAVFEGACADDLSWVSPDSHNYHCSDWADESYGADPCRTHEGGYMSELFKACPLTCKLCTPESPPYPRRLVRAQPTLTRRHSRKISTHSTTHIRERCLPLPCPASK